MIFSRLFYRAHHLAIEALVAQRRDDMASWDAIFCHLAAARMAVMRGHLGAAVTALNEMADREYDLTLNCDAAGGLLQVIDHAHALHAFDCTDEKCSGECDETQLCVMRCADGWGPCIPTGPYPSTCAFCIRPMYEERTTPMKQECPDRDDHKPLEPVMCSTTNCGNEATMTLPVPWCDDCERASHIDDSPAASPRDPGGIADAALEMWQHYASGCLNQHLSSIRERNTLANVMVESVSVLAKHAVALERLDPHHNAGKLAEAETLKIQTNVAMAEIHALHEKERQQAFVDGFAMGASFMLGAAHALGAATSLAEASAAPPIPGSAPDHDPAAFGGKAGA